MTCGGIFDIDQLKSDIVALEEKIGVANFWSNKEESHKTITELKRLKAVYEDFKQTNLNFQHFQELYELIQEEPDESMEAEFQQEFTKFTKEVDQLEIRSLLSSPVDPKDAILSIHPGSGGTESQDWAQMLMRMYIRWMEKENYKYKVIDFQPGEEAGVKSVTIEITGAYAYGYLRGESGVHRLVRISPFDANKRRHTSFTSVSVIPEMDEDVELEIEEKDLRIDVFRASGAGGQHVNRTESAVRITHIPTNTVAQCQSERSQHQNKEYAMKILRARLYQLKRESDRKKREEIAGEKKEISWGNQIRSYVFMPYTLAKDHRTGVETGNIQAVMDGEINLFIEGFLKQPKEKG